MANQNPTAMDVIRAAVKGILAEGCSITVADSPELVRVRDSRDEAEIVANLRQTDIELLLVNDKAGEELGSVVLSPYGDAVDAIVDWHLSLDDYLTDALVLIGLN